MDLFYPLIEDTKRKFGASDFDDDDEDWEDNESSDESEDVYLCFLSCLLLSECLNCLAYVRSMLQLSFIQNIF